MFHFNKRQRGVGLIEVLVAVVIVAFVALAVMRLQTAVIKSGSNAKARSVAINLAQRKRDDLMSFKCLVDDAADDTLPLAQQDCPKQTVAQGFPADEQIFLFNEILDSSVSTSGLPEGGKKKADGTLEFPSGTLRVGTVDYTISWDVQDYYYCDDSQPPSTTNCTPIADPYPDFKQISINVGWTDETNEVQSVTVEAAISSTNPLGLSNLEQGNAPNTPAPAVAYTPEQAPDVVAVPVAINIAGGDNVYKETSKPLPTVENQGDNVTTSFSVVTYSRASGAQTGITLSREEFATINCECEFNGQADSWSPTRIVLNEEGDSQTNQIGSFISKSETGTPVSGQPLLCNLCCRDHHDTNQDGSVASEDSYDPWRFWPFIASSLTTDTHYVRLSDGNHKHYKNRGQSIAVAGGNDQYFEACRFKRVGGILRLAQDWWLVETVTMPRDYLTNSTNLNAYIDWVEARLEYEIAARLAIAQAIGSNPLTKPTPPSGRDFLLLVPGAKAQGLSRSIYLDYMDIELLTAVQAKLNNVGDSTDNDTDWLSLVPFYEINTTLLSLWQSKPKQACTAAGGVIDANRDCINPTNNNVIFSNVISSEDPSVTVTNAEVDTVTNTAIDYYGEYSRGLTKVEPTVASTLTTASSTYEAYTRSMLRRSNSGLTPLAGDVNNNHPDPEEILEDEAIDPQDRDDTLRSDIVDVVSSGQAISGIFKATGVQNKQDVGDIVISGIPGGATLCATWKNFVETNSNAFCFQSPAAITGALTFSHPDGYTFCIDTDVDGTAEFTSPSVPFDTNAVSSNGTFYTNTAQLTNTPTGNELVIHVSGNSTCP